MHNLVYCNQHVERCVGIQYSTSPCPMDVLPMLDSFKVWTGGTRKQMDWGRCKLAGWWYGLRTVDHVDPGNSWRKLEMIETYRKPGISMTPTLKLQDLPCCISWNFKKSTESPYESQIGIVQAIQLQHFYELNIIIFWQSICSIFWHFFLHFNCLCWLWELFHCLKFARGWLMSFQEAPLPLPFIKVQRSIKLNQLHGKFPSFQGLLRRQLFTSERGEQTHSLEQNALCQLTITI